VLGVAADMALPGRYFGAGGVAQTVWNLLHGFEPAEGTKDHDLVYFDPDDLSTVIRAGGRAGGGPAPIPVRGGGRPQRGPRPHLLRQCFGRLLEPYRSTEEAISTWPTTASSVGVRRDADGFGVCAPFGLSGPSGMVARPNKAIVSRDVYEEKARWSARWPKLRIIPW
jgi:hypothetical protein